MAQKKAKKSPPRKKRRSSPAAPKKRGRARKRSGGGFLAKFVPRDVVGMGKAAGGGAVYPLGKAAAVKFLPSLFADEGGKTNILGKVGSAYAVWLIGNWFLGDDDAGKGAVGCVGMEVGQQFGLASMLGLEDFLGGYMVSDLAGYVVADPGTVYLPGQNGRMIALSANRGGVQDMGARHHVTHAMMDNMGGHPDHE